MKLCTTCQQEQDESQFAFKNKADNKLHNRCRACQAAITKKHYENNKELYKSRSKQTNKVYQERNKVVINSYKREHGCQICHESEPIALDFHHISNKTIEVSKMLNMSLSIDTIMSEISKCVILCANCHRKVHAGIYKV